MTRFLVQAVTLLTAVDTEGAGRARSTASGWLEARLAHAVAFVSGTLEAFSIASRLVAAFPALAQTIGTELVVSLARFIARRSLPSRSAHVIGVLLDGARSVGRVARPAEAVALVDALRPPLVIVAQLAAERRLVARSTVGFVAGLVVDHARAFATHTIARSAAFLLRDALAALLAAVLAPPPFLTLLLAVPALPPRRTFSSVAASSVVTVASLVAVGAVTRPSTVRTVRPRRTLYPRTSKLIELSMTALSSFLQQLRFFYLL